MKKEGTGIPSEERVEIRGYIEVNIEIMIYVG